MKIKDKLGKSWNKIKIFDDETPYGGKSFEEETLGEFMLCCNISPFDDMKKLQTALKECGIMQIK